MSDLLWGLIQHVHDNPRSDFLTYALGRLRRSKTLMTSTDFGATWTPYACAVKTFLPYRKPRSAS